MFIHDEARRHPNDRMVAPHDAVLDDADDLIVGDIVLPHRNVKPALHPGPHQLLGIGERDVVHADRHVELVRLVGDGAIELGRQRLLGAAATVDPDLDEVGLDLDVVVDGSARFLGSGHGIGHVDPRGIALGARSRPRHAGAGGMEQGRAGDDLFAQAQRDVAPAGAAAMHVGAIDEVADPDRGADAVEGEALHVIDQVLAGKGLLGHRPRRDVLESEMAVHIDHRRHHGLA
jgi:hypothetical protein